MHQGFGALPVMIGESPSMQQIKASIGQIAASDCPVLITGETGTGKELVAWALHHLSPRRSRPFVAINCAALPEGLLESELFGHERGAFTGAHTSRPGTLELAHGGTLFLDEIAEMSSSAQSKLLRAIEGHEVYRLGGKRPLRLDFRVLAATHQDLKEGIGRGRFREDLYFRLRTFHIHLPSLRERREDIPLLLAHYVAECNHRWGREVVGFTPEAQEALLCYRWPGNVRELRNLVEASCMGLSSPWISREMLPDYFRQQLWADQGLSSAERDRLLSVLQAYQGNRTQAARQLGYSRMTLHRKMRRYAIQIDPWPGSRRKKKGKSQG
ncbi:MAG: sigma-54-dependent Fis family transcriptional regulator [Candidatus Tectomicrobia bacterium]|uniref:Sigma-54-dependent Fis family transcriptional regulator n=1 Tax=Tectimicrobiota bacterium TaxID=2528274 RepID=A0A932CNX5_UNCTE|nr:sigma-54-dependent Fis family transcriptional regulator [Candidatus Tectomicrobia bacterium]